MITLRTTAAVRAPLGIRRAVPVVLGAGAVFVQILFPLTGGGTAPLTVLAVVLFASASITHALVERGVTAAAGLVVVAVGGGWLAEVVGLRTGLPFGEYSYTGSLGWEVAGVPAVVPLAWAMMAYPAVLVARRLVGAGAGFRRRLAVAVVAAWALASWDVFLDPQMVDAGHWRWAHPAPSLPGVDGIPLTNHAGWLLVALALGAALDRVLDRGAPAAAVDDRLPFALYLWTYAGSVMASAVFFGRPTVAVTGGVLMGLVAVPLAVRLARTRRASS